MSFWEKQLRDAVFNNDLTLVRSILDSYTVRTNGRVGREEWVSGQAPLHCAASHGRNAMVPVLLKAGFDINSYVAGVFDSDRATGLHYAVTKNHPETVRLFLDLGADWSLNGVLDTNRGSALDMARRKGSHTIVDIIRGHVSRQLNKEHEAPLAGQIGSYVFVNATKGHESDHHAGNLLQTVKERVQSLPEKEKKLVRARSVKKEVDTKEEEIKLLTNGLATLRSDPDFMTDAQIRQLEIDLDEVKALMAVCQETAASSTKKEGTPKDDAKLCPVCVQAPQTVFECVECDNWLCGACRSDLLNCPICRQDFESKPPRRNTGIEKMLSRI